MYVKILLAAAALTIAAPAMAKSKAAPAADLPTGPVSYSQLADIDAKMNPPAPVKAVVKHKHHAKAKAAAAPAAK